jgi:hypothetical protein
MSCVACRQGRRRCDGGRICGRCSRLGNICVYDRAPRSSAALPHVVEHPPSADSAIAVRLTEDERGALRCVFDYSNKLFEAGLFHYR